MLVFVKLSTKMRTHFKLSIKISVLHLVLLMVTPFLLVHNIVTGASVVRLLADRFIPYFSF
tara:strand:+ start:2116 stop:2298 length:183 start_codon:yes stop_codon:yes gene_type:complete